MPSHAVVSNYLIGPYSEEAITKAAKSAREQAGGACTAILCFVSSSWREHLGDLCELLQIHAHCPKIFGCSADGLIAGKEELEETSGCSLLFLRLEATNIAIAEGKPKAGDSHLLLGSPFEDPTEFLKSWDKENPGFPIYGGLASGGRTAEDIFLFTEKGALEQGDLLLRLRGRVGIRGAVSHGCRPIGEPVTITGVDGNIIETVASRKVCDVLEETYADLSEAEQETANGNILVGIAMSEYREEHHQGDFLISSILGGDPKSGSIAIAAEPDVGQTLQFQLRDRDSAHDDLESICRGIAAKGGAEEILGGLLFTCTGRGSHLFGEAGHDSGLLAEYLGDKPMAGFFCNGEVAPVGKRSFLHAFTASMAFFVDSATDPSDA